MNTTNPIITTYITAIAIETNKYLDGLSLVSVISVPTSVGNLATIPAKSIIEIPFPIPLSLILLPIHTTSIAPATKQLDITTAANTPSNPVVYLTAPIFFNVK